MRVERVAQQGDPEGEHDTIREFPYAGNWRRLFAFLLDLVLGLVFFGMVLFALGVIDGIFELGLLATMRANEEAAMWIIGILSYFAYFTLTEWRFGATPAKRLLGLRVTTDFGGEIDWTASLLRNLVRPIDALGGFLLAGPPQRQRLGDRLGNTVVLDVR